MNEMASSQAQDAASQAQDAASQAQDAAAYDPPALSIEELERNNIFARSLSPVTLSIGEGVLKAFPVTSAILEGRTQGWSRIHLRYQDRPIQAYVTDGVIQSLIGTLDPAIVVEDLEPETLAMLVEFTLAPLFNGGEESGASALAIDSVTLAASPPPARLAPCFRLEGVHDGYLLLLGSDDDAERIGRLLSRLPPRPKAFTDLDVSIALRVGWTQLTLAEWQSGGVGDGIVVESDELTRQMMIAVTGERFMQLVDIRANGLVLSGPLLSLPTDLSREYLMAKDSAADGGTAASSGGGGIAALPITLVFELGRVQIPLSELESLDQGYVFDLAKQPTRSVEILSSGKKIGSGEVVRIGEALGVRVTGLEKR